MRFSYIISAALVCGVAYFIVFDRARLSQFGADTGLTSLFSTASTAEQAPEDSPKPAEPEPAKEASIEAADAKKTPKKTPKKATSVIAIKSTARLAENLVFLRGQSRAARQVSVRAETSGLVISEPLRKGTEVKKDQILCRLDPANRPANLARAQATLSEARARADESKANLDIAAQLLTDGFGSEVALKNAQAKFAASKSAITAAEAGIASVEKDLERLQIRAPFSGLLEADTAELGSLLQPGAVCSTVIQLNPIKLIGFIPETDISKITLGANATAILASKKKITGKVSFVSRSADNNTRTFGIEITANNTDLSVSDGETADIAIDSEGIYAHFLPQSALTLNDDGALGVRVDRGSIARFVPVEIIRDTVKGVWATGLNNEENVIIVGQDYVSDGAEIISTFRQLRQ